MSDTDASAISNENLPYFLESEILSSLPISLIILNAKGLIVWMNAAAKKLLNQDYTNESWVNVIHKIVSPREDDGHQVSLVNGRRVHVAISSLDSLPGEVVVLTDLTASREYEQARENQKQLLAIGRMTAQLAHQIRTPLTSAILYTEHLSGLHYAEPRANLWLARLQACHASIEQQIKNLLVFVRGEKVEKESINLRAWGEILGEKIKDSFEFVDSESLSSGCELPSAAARDTGNSCPALKKNESERSLNRTAHCDFQNNLPDLQVRINSEAVSGAVLNLIHNSVQAGAMRIRISLSLKNERLEIIVEDNGKGMSEEVKLQALDPFYTTKAQGTGLGLAVVNAIAKSHSGEVKIESTLGQGSCILFSLKVINV